MCVCMHMCVHVCARVQVCNCTRMCAGYVHMCAVYVCVYVHACVCVFVYVRVCVGVLMNSS